MGLLERVDRPLATATEGAFDSATTFSLPADVVVRLVVAGAASVDSNTTATGRFFEPAALLPLLDETGAAATTFVCCCRRGFLPVVIAVVADVSLLRLRFAS